jgi:Methane oxygenase PmoA
MSYIAKQHLAHDQFGYVVQDESTGRWLGGVGANYFRSWVFPLYTPRGLTVLQEFPFDHPFHNGLWVAQGPIQFGGETVHFWPMPPARRPGESLFTHMGRIETVGLPTVEPHDRGVRFTLQAVWRTGAGAPVLDERRTVDLYAVEDGTVCDVTTVQTASYGALQYEASKFGAICVRTDPRLTPVVGAEVIADGGRRGKAEVALQQANAYVAYESRAVNHAGDCFGLLLAVPGAQPHEWFIRDYGLATYNPMFEQPRDVAFGDALRVQLRVVAYDEPLTDARAQRWLA